MENNLKIYIYVCVCIYIYINYIAVHLKLTQYCKSIITRFFKKPAFSKPNKDVSLIPGSATCWMYEF